MSPPRIALATTVLVATLAVPVAEAGSGCSPSQCMPKTGKYVASRPQQIEAVYGNSDLRATVSYVKAGRTRASSYGNRVRVDAFLMRYFCAEQGVEWTQTGVMPVTIPLDAAGKGTLKVPAKGQYGEHTWRFRFKRDTFTGSVAGSYTSFGGPTCAATVSFRGKRRS